MDRSKAYAWSVVLLTAVIMIVLASNEVDLPSLGALLFWIASLAAAYLLPVSLGYGTEVTMGIPILLALAITFDPFVAMVIAGISAIDLREIRREIALHRALFNRAQVMLAVGGASAVLTFYRADPTNIRIGILSVAAAASIHVLLNLSLVAVAVHFDRGIPILSAFRGLLPEPVAGFWMSYALLTCLGVVTALAYKHFSAWAVAAILIPLLFARISLLGARAQQELSERVRKQQEALLVASEKVFEEREQERKRIAADIHDSSLQMLAAAAYGCGNATDFIGAGRVDLAQDAISSAQSALDAAIKALRESLVRLRKSSVEEGGLMETVQKYVDQVSTVWGTNVQIEGSIQHEPPIPVALAAFQILQEGLINAMKHAHSDTVSVRIKGDGEGMVHIVVEDNGPGFDPEAEVGADHVGMRLMKERAARVGGRIELNSKRGSGTRLEAILPGGISQ